MTQHLRMKIQVCLSSSAHLNKIVRLEWMERDGRGVDLHLDRGERRWTGETTQSAHPSSLRFAPFGSE